MRLIGFLRIILLFFWMVPLLSACAGQPQASPPVNPPSLIDPTSVVIPFQTPKPTATLPPVIPTITLTPNSDPDYYYGGFAITMDDVGKTLELKVRQSFLLSLGDNYQWTITIEPAQVISQNMKVTPDPGDQGVFIARHSGKASFKAIGSPTCRTEQPPCARPLVLFIMTVVVK